MVVDRWWHGAVAHCQQADNRLDCTRSAQEVTRHRLRGRDCHGSRSISEGVLDCNGLRCIVRRRRRPVSVDVVDVARIELCILKRGEHGAACPIAARAGQGDVVGVGGHAVSQNLAVNMRTARLRTLERLKHKSCGSFAHHKPITVCIERSRGAFRIVIASRHRTRRTEPRNSKFAHRRLGAPGNHEVGSAPPNDFGSVTDRICRRGTGGDSRRIWSVEVIGNRDDPAGHVRNDLGDCQRRHTTRPSGAHHVYFVLHR